jgi:hypothetical protein
VYSADAEFDGCTLRGLRVQRQNRPIAEREISSWSLPATSKVSRQVREREVVLKLKANGSKLTGTMTISPGLEGEIENGKIDGDKVFFVFVRGDVEMECNGKVSAKEVKLEMLRNERPIPMTLKKQ